MESFDVSEVIAEHTKAILKKISHNTASQVVIKGSNYGDYFVLRKLGQNTYNFVALENNYDVFFDKAKVSEEQCIMGAIREGKNILIFSSFEELSFWYLTKAEVSNQKFDYIIQRTEIKDIF